MVQKKPQEDGGIVGFVIYQYTQRPHSSSFLGVPYRILNMNPQKELLWSLWVVASTLQYKSKHSGTRQDPS